MADTDVAHLRDALADAELEREALLSRLSLLESAYKELEKELARANADRAGAGAHARFGRSSTRPPRAATDEAPDDDSTAVVLVATRLAREGYSRGEVESFLSENFCHIDVGSTVTTAFGDEPDREPEPVEA